MQVSFRGFYKVFLWNQLPIIIIVYILLPLKHCQLRQKVCTVFMFEPETNYRLEIYFKMYRDTKDLQHMVSYKIHYYVAVANNLHVLSLKIHLHVMFWIFKGKV